MMKALKESAANSPAVLNPREVALTSLYPETDISFMEVNMLQRKSLRETPSQMFLPANSVPLNPISGGRKNINASQDLCDKEGLNLDILLTGANFDFVYDDEDNQNKRELNFFDRGFAQDEMRKESFNLSVPLQQLLLPTVESRSNNNISGLIGSRPSSGKLSDFFMQGRSIFQSPMKKLSHPFEFPAQYSPKVIRTLRSMSFEVAR